MIETVSEGQKKTYEASISLQQPHLYSTHPPNPSIAPRPSHAAPPRPSRKKKMFWASSQNYLKLVFSEDDLSAMATGAEKKLAMATVPPPSQPSMPPPPDPQAEESTNAEANAEKKKLQQKTAKIRRALLKVKRDARETRRYSQRALSTVQALALPELASLVALLRQHAEYDKKAELFYSQYLEHERSL